MNIEHRMFISLHPSDKHLFFHSFLLTRVINPQLGLPASASLLKVLPFDKNGNLSFKGALLLS